MLSYKIVAGLSTKPLFCPLQSEIDSVDQALRIKALSLSKDLHRSLEASASFHRTRQRLDMFYPGYETVTVGVSEFNLAIPDKADRILLLAKPFFDSFPPGYLSDITFSEFAYLLTNPAHISCLGADKEKAFLQNVGFIERYFTDPDKGTDSVLALVFNTTDKSNGLCGITSVTKYDNNDVCPFPFLRMNGHFVDQESKLYSAGIRKSQLMLQKRPAPSFGQLLLQRVLTHFRGVSHVSTNTINPDLYLAHTENKGGMIEAFSPVIDLFLERLLASSGRPLSTHTFDELMAGWFSSENRIFDEDGVYLGEISPTMLEQHDERMEFSSHSFDSRRRIHIGKILDTTGVYDHYSLASSKQKLSGDIPLSDLESKLDSLDPKERRRELTILFFDWLLRKKGGTVDLFFKLKHASDTASGPLLGIPPIRHSNGASNGATKASF